MAEIIDQPLTAADDRTDNIWRASHRNERFLSYHRKQFDAPYSLTVAFLDFLARRGLFAQRGQTAVDLCCGMGANTRLLAERLGSDRVLGVEINPEIVAEGARRLAGTGVTLEQGDIYALPERYIGAFDGVITFHSISSLPFGDEPLAAMARLQPKWIAISSLFLEGNFTVSVEVKDYSNPIPPDDHAMLHFSYYSIERTQAKLRELGFSEFAYERFEPDRDLPRRDGAGWSSYTETLNDGRRLEIAGPLLFNWYFLLATA